MSEQTIPKIFHLVWLGTAPLPPLAETYEALLRQHHPGWEIRWWRDENLPVLENGQWFDAALHWGSKSCVARYEIIRDHGGVYVDLDMQCQKSIEPLLQGKTAVVTAVQCRPEDTIRWWVEPSFLAAVPHHPFFEHVVSNMSAWAQRFADHPEGWHLRIGPGYFGSMVREWLQQMPLGDSDVDVLDPAMVNPIAWWDFSARAGAYPDAYMVHRYWGTWTDDPAPAASG